jgi:type III secretion protein R
MTMIVLLGVLGLVPFVLTMITSFAKLVVVGGLIRQALGTPQIPPTTVLTGLALILTIHIMSPVVIEVYSGFEAARAQAEAQEGGDEEGEDGPGVLEIVQQYSSSIFPPVQTFLEKHSDPRNIALFESLREELRRAQGVTGPAMPLTQSQIDTVTILAPAFVLTELTEAFQIGFLIFIPFLILDLVVSNVLLAMGMHMLSPVTISLPLKILLFVLIDGWTLILRGVVLGYA